MLFRTSWNLNYFDMVVAQVKIFQQTNCSLGGTTRFGGLNSGKLHNLIRALIGDSNL